VVATCAWTGPTAPTASASSTAGATNSMRIRVSSVWRFAPLEAMGSATDGRPALAPDLNAGPGHLRPRLRRH
jgi:hypothetical protein